MAETKPLQPAKGGGGYGSVNVPPEGDVAAAAEAPQSCVWNAVHFAGFFVGGGTFILGSMCYLYPHWKPSGHDAAELYVLGSCGFLLVDVLEFFTFTAEPLLRRNIGLSTVGSTLYVIGSAGFLPSVAAASPQLGPWGFILGSAFIGSSQLWKTYRIGSAGGETECAPGSSFAVANLLRDRDQFTQVGVELSAGMGAWFFFFSTLMYDYGPIDHWSYLRRIIYLWIAGSCFFFLGSLFLGVRHFVMGR